ncbi:MAG: hypothetical protein EHM78_02345 [Myxococcaceae bacterium]|nr:MAG: hypothetical protein EHM78_02345 [Myxococcaceae bacterium]
MGSQVTSLRVGHSVMDSRGVIYKITHIDGFTDPVTRTKYTSKITMRALDNDAERTMAAATLYAIWNIHEQPGGPFAAQPTGLPVPGSGSDAQPRRTLTRGTFPRQGRPSPTAGAIVGLVSEDDMSKFITVDKVGGGSSEYEDHHEIDDDQEFDEEPGAAAPPLFQGEPSVINVAFIRCFYARKDNRPGSRITFADGKGFAVFETMDKLVEKIRAVAPELMSKFVKVTKIRSSRHTGETDEVCILNGSFVRTYYPRHDGRVGTRITFADGGGFAVRETADVLTATLHADQTLSEPAGLQLAIAHQPAGEQVN